MPNQNKPIFQALRKEIDTERYGIGLTKFIQVHTDMGLLRTRQQGHTVESIRDAMLELREMSVIKSYFAIYEADLVRQRKARRLQRRRFWAAGVNDIVAVDQHDKWLQLILSYYLDTIENLDMPLVTQSDPGTENFGIANGHTMLHQWYDPSLQGTLQHRWMRTKKNVMPEIAWSQLRTCDRNKVLPHGIPELIYRSAEDFGALDFKIKIEKAAVDHVRATYIKPGHPVFDLVPSDLGDTLQMCYERLGRLVVNRKSAWTVYLGLLHIFSTLIETRPQMPLPDNSGSCRPSLKSQGLYHQDELGSRVESR
ncbi:uncharacterized protein F5891DRAFT_1131149 [Suillus fuscotomentosus]|uniref:Uncharacterized protein n=1 Tax=Suillus fuscotomentosus TaxID=1912939 RepID=A0AAD4HDP1_9AGAM|nr:uncharacterized protein F5891DRAFT_1131149 [Suillus fuscotomentosus]KAG1893790.1 hypothetical protein F5891DRAFT_1131149 [Suillus fuscotomentosus]